MMPEIIIDIEGLKKIAAGDDAFVTEILSLYSERTEKDIVELKAAHAEQNWPAVQFVVHRMRSAAVPLGIDGLLIALKKIELNLKQDILDGVNDLLNQVYQLSALAIENAKNELKTTSV